MDNTISTAQVLGLTTSLVLSGVNIGTSYLVLPILYTRPTSITTPIFSELYFKGAVTLVPLGIFSAACSALVAYLEPSQRNLWAFAAVATISQTPWTVFVMMKTNNRLNALAASEKEQEKASDEEVVGLLKQWTWMNFVRGSLALAGGVAGIWALVERQV
jgi:hypothetical protein